MEGRYLLTAEDVLGWPTASPMPPDALRRRSDLRTPEQAHNWLVSTWADAWYFESLRHPLDVALTAEKLVMLRDEFEAGVLHDGATEPRNESGAGGPARAPAGPRVLAGGAAAGARANVAGACPGHHRGRDAVSIATQMRVTVGVWVAASMARLPWLGGRFLRPAKG